jgi:hypothetical protein
MGASALLRRVLLFFFVLLTESLVGVAGERTTRMDLGGDGLLFGV